MATSHIKRDYTLLEMREASNISREIGRMRQNWIGHILRKDPADDCVVALGRTLEGRRTSDRPKTTWRQMVEVERRRDKSPGTQRAEKLHTATCGRQMSNPFCTERNKIRLVIDQLQIPLTSFDFLELNLIELFLKPF